MTDMGTQIRELQAQLGLTQNQAGVMTQTRTASTPQRAKPCEFTNQERRGGRSLDLN